MPEQNQPNRKPGQLSKEDLQIIKRIEGRGPMPLTDSEKEDIIVNQILLRRLMYALQNDDVVAARSSQPQEETDQTSQLPPEINGSQQKAA